MLLSAENLYKIYSKKKVVNNVSIYVNQSEIVGLLGPNGAGKTTTFYMLVGQVSADSGNIFLDDLDITNADIELIADTIVSMGMATVNHYSDY